MESLSANGISYIGIISVQEAGQGGGGNVNSIFDATLMQAAGDRNKYWTWREIVIGHGIMAGNIAH